MASQRPQSRDTESRAHILPTRLRAHLHASSVLATFHANYPFPNPPFMSATEDPHLPSSTRFSYTPSAANLAADSNRPVWSTPAGSLDKHRFIHTSTTGANAGHQPFHLPHVEGDFLASLGSLQLHDKIHIDFSRAAEEPNAIPVYEYGKHFVGDPILFVESVSEVGKKYGAVKVKMGSELAQRFLSSRQINPDAFIFHTNRVLNNPSENELCSRLRFYSELIRFHTGHPSNGSEGPGVEIEKTKTETPEPNQGSAESEKKEHVLTSGSVQAVKAEEFPSTPTAELANSDNPTVKNEGTTTIIKSEPPLETIKKESADAELAQDQKQAVRPKVPMFLAKVPMMDKRPLDLFELFRYVIVRGGYNEVIKKKLWAQIGRELGYKSKIASSLSTWLKISYARILYPFEIYLGDRKFEVAALADKSNEPEARKRAKLNSGAPLILGSARELHRSVKIKAAKGFLLNKPHLVDIKSPFVIGVKDSVLKKEGEKVEGKSSHRKPEELILPISSAAQVNNFVKWLAIGLSSIQDSGRSDVNLRHANYRSLKQFMDKDAKFREFLMASYTNTFNGGEDRDSHEQDGPLTTAAASLTGKQVKSIPLREFERIYWEYTVHKGEANLLDGMKLESGYCVPNCLARSSFSRLGDEFSDVKDNLHAQAFLNAAAQQETVNPATSDVQGLNESNSGVTNPSADTATNYLLPASTPEVSSNTPIPSQPKSESDTSKIDLPESNEISTPSSNGNRRSLVKSNEVLEVLNVFNLHNIPILPNSLLGAYGSTDLNNRDLTNSTLNVGMTFSTENWKCEDHFTQLCNFHIYGAKKRWFFIPELEFEKFEALVAETVERPTQTDEISCVNVNYREGDWQFDQLAKVINTEEEIANAEYDCLLKSLESLVNPYPDIRVNHKSENFQALIDNLKKKRRNILLNQEHFFTPELLRERGINFTTTLQEAGEYVFKFPKTYSSTISLGLNLNEEVNFASKLWLDYAEEGESWLAKQDLLPNILVFRLLINFAQLYESSDLTHIHFDAEIYDKVLSLYSKLLDRELESRQQLRSIIKIKETTIDEKNVSEVDHLSDDTLQNAFPSKIVITELSTHQQFTMTLAGFLKYFAEATVEGSQIQPNVVNNDDYSIELHMLYSDDKLRNFQKLLNSYSVDFEGWLTSYDELMKTDDEVTIKTYKGLLSDGWKIYSALSSSNDNYKQFAMGTQAEGTSAAGRVKFFKEQVENLQAFVDESMELVEDCQTILSLKHQQRIRNGGGDQEPQVNSDQLGDSLQLLLKLVKKIPKANFFTPEFDQIFEFKNEIENFDRACRALIQKQNASLSELNDMISLGTSFGIQISSLDFLRRLRDRQKWLATYETIVSGGDPFSGKKDIFSLTDMVAFRDEGMQVLASADKEKIQAIDEYVITGRAYDATVTDYFLQNSVLNKVDMKVLDAIIEDMVERSKKTGKERLFVTLETYSRLLDLKAQAPLIKFLWQYPEVTHNLFDITQTLSELDNCGFKYDGTLIQNDLAKTHEWLDNTCSVLKQATLVKNSRPKQRLSTHTMKLASDPELLRTAFGIFNKCATAFAGEDVDGFVRSSSWIFYKNLEVHFEPNNPARYCMCRDYEDGVMIECDKCHEWYHVTCANVKSDLDDENEKYSCPVCLLLEEFKKTGEFKEPLGKVSLDTIVKLIARAETLRIIPQPEVQMLRDIADLLNRAMNYFEMRKSAVLNTSYEKLYSSFLSRKYFGSPISIAEPLTGLFQYLKDVDLPSVFKAEAKEREQKFAQLVPQIQNSDVESGTNVVLTAGSNTEINPSLATSESSLVASQIISPHTPESLGTGEAPSHNQPVNDGPDPTQTAHSTEVEAQIAPSGTETSQGFVEAPVEKVVEEADEEPSLGQQKAEIQTSSTNSAEPSKLPETEHVRMESKEVLQETKPAETTSSGPETEIQPVEAAPIVETHQHEVLQPTTQAHEEAIALLPELAPESATQIPLDVPKPGELNQTEDRLLSPAEKILADTLVQNLEERSDATPGQFGETAANRTEIASMVNEATSLTSNTQLSGEEVDISKKEPAPPAAQF